MMHGHDDSRWCNPSDNESFDSILSRAMSRRQVLKGGLGVSLAAIFGSPLAGCASNSSAGFEQASPKFAPIPVSSADAVTVPTGYAPPCCIRGAIPCPSAPRSGRTPATPLPSRRCRPACTTTASITFRCRTARPLVQRAAGDQPRIHRRRPAARGRYGQLECREGAQGAERARRLGDRGASSGGRWEVVRPSPYARRVTAATPMRSRARRPGTR